MADARFRILPTLLLEPYRKAVAVADLERHAALEESELSVDAFSFYTSVSAVYSSKIEGEETRTGQLREAQTLRHLLFARPHPED